MRRAVFRDALRRGDPLATARAASRLRAHISDLNAQELELLRASHQTVGRAIREARSRRVAVPVVAPPAAPRRVRRRAFPFALVASFALLASALTGLLSEPLQLQNNDGGDGGGEPAAVPSEAPIVPILPQSRGRVVLAVAVVQQPQATIAPEIVVASPSPGPSSGPSAPAGSAAPSGSGGPGSGGGPGGGGPGGTGSPRPTPRPTFARPTPAPPLPRGFARLTGIVVDADTGRGLPDVCVSLGPCTSVSKKTDANGRWTFDLPVGNGGLIWGLEFAKSNYSFTTYTQASRPGYITIPTQRLTPSG